MPTGDLEGRGNTQIHRKELFTYVRGLYTEEAIYTQGRGAYIVLNMGSWYAPYMQC